MRLNPSDIQAGESAYDRFPVFKSFKACKQRVGNIEPDTLLRYVLWAYSADSEFASQTDLVKIREGSAEKVGWKKSKKGEWPETIASILSNEEPVIRGYINIVFRLQNNLRYVSYRSNLDTFYQLTDELRKPLDEDLEGDKKVRSANLKLTISEGLSGMMKRIEADQNELFSKRPELEDIAKENDLEDSDYGEGISEYMARLRKEGKL